MKPVDWPIFSVTHVVGHYVPHSASTANSEIQERPCRIVPKDLNIVSSHVRWNVQDAATVATIVSK
jgi:hypothetical protein